MKVPKSIMSEHDIQVAYVQWFRARYPKYILQAIPNGGHRHFLTGVKLKKEGVLAGSPDLEIKLPEGKVIHVEMKTEKGRLSKTQEELIKGLHFLGHKILVCYGLDDAIKQTEEAIKEVVDNASHNR
ncbi:VRR-NUC domain-containing protein [Francisella tularensis]|uniref:VRR-NUC domain-containing protein n=1 Tax=Francisella tularensis TaxID=263 RepID=UPI0008F552AD|nr:VRR-NUC domain-containing protein [Francisella tularensis]APA83255.1 hypothetical protein N894_1271 [Francisella tularensis subsp. novicida PA10-7858]